MDRNSEPFVSVVIPTYNRDRELCDTLRGLLWQAYPYYEIIIVDQSARHLPATEEFLRRHAPQIRYCRIQEPSLPQARNVGVRIAKGEIVLFVDDDVMPDSDLISAHASAYLAPEVGGVAGRRTVPGLVEPLEPVGVIDRWGKNLSNFSSTVPATVQWASGCHMSFRRELILRAGLFEPRFLGTFAYEDVDFCFRVRGLGYEIRFVPEATLVHLRASSGGCDNRAPGLRYHYSAIHNRLLFFMRHYSWRELPRLFAGQMAAALAYVRKSHNPFAVVPLAGAFAQAFHSYLGARSSLPREARR